MSFGSVAGRHHYIRQTCSGLGRLCKEHWSAGQLTSRLSEFCTDVNGLSRRCQSVFGADQTSPWHVLITFSSQVIIRVGFWHWNSDFLPFTILLTDKKLSAFRLSPIAHHHSPLVFSLWSIIAQSDYITTYSYFIIFISIWPSSPIDQIDFWHSRPFIILYLVFWLTNLW